METDKIDKEEAKNWFARGYHLEPFVSDREVEEIEILFEQTWSKLKDLDKALENADKDEYIPLEDLEDELNG